MLDKVLFVVTGYPHLTGNMRSTPRPRLAGRKDEVGMSYWAGPGGHFPRDFLQVGRGSAVQ
jgi:ADP-ribose pyrophosphatase YjhB (NUDIX family)